MDAISPALFARRQPWLLLGLFVLFAALNIKYAIKVLDDDNGPRSALMRWHNQLREFHDGENIWAKHGHPHPPIMALILSPLAHLPAAAASLVWFYLKLVMAVVAIHWTLRLFHPLSNQGPRHLCQLPVCQASEDACPTASFPLWAQVLAIALSLYVIQRDLTHGNVNVFILFLTIAGLVAFWRHGDLFAGLLLALAAACKVTPLLFLPYLLWKRAWRAALAMMAGLAVFFVVIPALFLGWDNHSRYLHSWYQHMVRPYASSGEVLYTDHKNQALAGMAHRLLSHSPSFTEFDFEQNRYVATEHHNFLYLDKVVVQWFVMACLAGYVVMVAWACRPRFGMRDGSRLATEASLVILGMLLFSERTWKHHAVTLLVPFTLLAYLISSPATGLRQRRVLVGLLTAAGACMLLGSGVFGARFADLALAYGAWTIAFLLLFVAIVVAGDHRSRPLRILASERGA